MAGYSGFSMSNNAVAAYNHGEMPASKLALEIGHGATAAGVESVLRPSSWHHTSKMYNRTNFYNLESAAEDLANDAYDCDAPTDAQDRSNEWLRAAIIQASRDAKRIAKEAARAEEVRRQETRAWTWSRIERAVSMGMNWAEFWDFETREQHGRN